MLLHKSYINVLIRLILSTSMSLWDLPRPRYRNPQNQCILRMPVNQFFVDNSKTKAQKIYVASQVEYKHAHSGSLEPKMKSPWRSYQKIWYSGFLHTRAQKGVAHRQGQADSLKLPSLTLFSIPKWVDSSFQKFWNMELVLVPDKNRFASISHVTFFYHFVDFCILV